jgi:hypothetical protein
MMHALLAETLAHQLALYEPWCAHMLKVTASRILPLAGSDHNSQAHTYGRGLPSCQNATTGIKIKDPLT